MILLRVRTASSRTEVQCVLIRLTAHESRGAPCESTHRLSEVRLLADDSHALKSVLPARIYLGNCQCIAKCYRFVARILMMTTRLSSIEITTTGSTKNAYEEKDKKKTIVGFIIGSSPFSLL